MTKKKTKAVQPFGDLHDPEKAEVKIRRAGADFDLELAFTETYQQYRDAHVAIREAMCLRVLYPALFQPIQPGDRIAGRVAYRQVGLGLEQASGGPGYYCRVDGLRREMAGAHLDPETRERLEAMIAFWEREATIDGKLVALLPPDVEAATTNPIANMGGRLAGALLDFAKLVRLGIPGLRAEIAAGRARAGTGEGDAELYRAMAMALDLLADVCRHYARQARRLADEAAGIDRVEDYRAMADALDHVAAARPETFRQGLQLLWLYALISGVTNYGRIDVALGDLYARDVDTGLITEAEALSLLQSLWRLIADRNIFFNGRVIVGGMGRANEANADRLALLALEATRTVHETEPQTTMRFYRGQNPALMAKALAVLGEGRTYPMLYNDDVNVPAAAHAFGVDAATAQHYLPYGCGEYALDHTSFGSPNCSLNMMKALEVALFNGVDPRTGSPLGLRTGAAAALTTFDDLLDAYQRQLAHYIAYLAQRHALEYQAERASAAFLYVSILFDDCIARGKALVDGGARYLGGVIETFGMVNTADSLAAIKKVVYDEGRLSLPQLAEILTADFEGHETERQWLLDAPKYGNDEDAVDDILAAISRHAAETTRAQAAKVGLDYYLIVNINNYTNVALGKITGASADGRRAGEPLANGNTPTAGMDRKGITAFLNSIVKPDPAVHAGYVHNMKFSRQMFTAERPKLEALLATYFAKGGTQAMITVVSRGDLEAAMREPEKYRNLMVRVGGFSARFVELSREVQRDLINRTLY